jgi:hypothetical protein
MTEELKDKFSPEWVWEAAFRRADAVMAILNPLFVQEQDQGEHTFTENLISQTMSLFLIACFMNQYILDETHLEETLEAAKKMTKMYIEQNQKTMN